MKKRPHSTQLAVPIGRRFGYRFNMIVNALAQQILRHVQREHGLNLAEYRIMIVLASFEAPSIRDIARHSQLDKAHVTRGLAALSKRGLVTQVIDTRDRRLRIVRLTPVGQAVMSAIEPFSNERHRRLEACLAPNELRVLDKALSRILAEAERMLAETDANVPRRQIEGAGQESRLDRRKSTRTRRI